MSTMDSPAPFDVTMLHVYYLLEQAEKMLEHAQPPSFEEGIYQEMVEDAVQAAKRIADHAHTLAHNAANHRRHAGEDGDA